MCILCAIFANYRAWLIYLFGIWFIKHVISDANTNDSSDKLVMLIQFKSLVVLPLSFKTPYTLIYIYIQAKPHWSKDTYCAVRGVDTLFGDFVVPEAAGGGKHWKTLGQRFVTNVCMVRGVSHTAKVANKWHVHLMWSKLNGHF